MPISDPFDFPPFVPCSQRGTSAGALTFPGLSGLSQVLLQPHAMHSPQLTDVPLGAVSIKLVVSQNRTLPCPPPAPHQNITQVAAPSCTCTPVSTNTHSRVAWSPLPPTMCPVLVTVRPACWAQQSVARPSSNCPPYRFMIFFNVSVCMYLYLWQKKA